MGLCKLTHEDVRRWKETGKRPSCKFHNHVTPTKADEMEENDEAIVLREERAVIVYPCVEHYVWTGALSGGFQVLQLRPSK